MENIILAINNDIKKRGLSQNSIANKLGLPQKTVNNLLNGKTKKPDYTVVFALATELGIAVDSNLLLNTPNKRNDAPDTPLEAPDLLGKIRPIPIISWAQAGTDGFFEDSYPVGCGIGSLSWFDDLRDNNAYALQIRGDSMIDRYYPGDYVVVSPAAGVQSGDYAVIKLKDGQVMVKKVKSKNGEFILSSSNPEYDDLFVSKEDVLFTHRIIGSKDNH